ncbi:MAG: hypothetical protein WC718_00290 [Phycisphaerales bacterium]|jgi:hypothetical protein
MIRVIAAAGMPFTDSRETDAWPDAKVTSVITPQIVAYLGGAVRQSTPVRINDLEAITILHQKRRRMVFVKHLIIDAPRIHFGKL